MANKNNCIALEVVPGPELLGDSPWDRIGILTTSVRLATGLDNKRSASRPDDGVRDAERRANRENPAK